LTEALPAKMLAEAKILAVKIAVFIIFIFLFPFVNPLSLMIE
jgi:hypothetical protein